MDDELLTIDGFDDAIIGVSESGVPRLVYDIEKLAELVMRKENVSEEDAYEYITYNISCAYVGENTPIIIRLGKLSKFLN
mgnify:CR=1 FL=1